MGARASAPQTPAAGNHDLAVGPDQIAPDAQSPARRQGLELGAKLATTVNHFFPDLFDWLGEVRDRRDQNRITYGRRFMTWMGLMLFLLKLGSRRRLRFELDTPEARANLNVLSREEQETMAHSDSLNYFLGRVPAASLPLLRRKMVQRLLRMKALDHGRLMGHFVIVFDGTGQLRFNERHCANCLEQKHGDKTLYFHNVLEAKLVTPDGFAISLESEFIENADPKATKQDCELKAFARLAERLKKNYPQLSLCLCLDALYANGTAMDICRRNRWKYIIVFKEGSLPALWQEYQSLVQLCPKNRKTHTSDAGVRQTFAWVQQLEHVDDQKRHHRVNAFQCEEKQDGKDHFFAWLTNWSIQSDNVATLGNRGGRCRWKIENEGFNVQKNSGFNLEHAYSTGLLQIKNFYVLLQIAHLILQLVERGNLLSRDAKKLFGSLANLARRLTESIRNVLISADANDPALAAKIQIRFNTS
jgi:hypothetical protein